MTTTEPRPGRGSQKEPKPGQERDPELGALTVPDEGQFDDEFTTAFDWQGNPPQLDYDRRRVIEYAEREWPRKVEDLLSADGRGRMVEAALTLPIRQAVPKIEPAEGDSGEAEFIESALFDSPESGGMRTPITEVIGQVANALLIRRTFHEKVFTRRDDGKVIYKKLAWRPPESCEVWRDPRTAEILGFRQYQYLDVDGKVADRAPGSEEDDPHMAVVPANRAFIYTHGKHRDPLRGVSDLEVAVWAHEMKIRVVNLWLAFLDGQATPRVAVYGGDKTEVEKRARAMAALRGGGVAGFIRKGDESIFDTIETSGTGATAFQEMLRWLDNVQSESIMAGHLGLTGGATEGRGSLALSKDSSGLYLASRNGVAREIADAFTQDVVSPLVALNFGTGAAFPRFTFESVDTSKIQHVFELFQTFSTAGSLQIPTEFVHLLLEMVAQYLDLPSDRVESMIEEAEKAIQQGREAQQEADRRTAAGEPAPGSFIDPEKQVLADKVSAVGKVMADAKAARPDGGRTRDADGDGSVGE